MADRLPTLSENALRYPQFYWACACEAARGTTERANSWAWLIGAGAIWLGVIWRGMTQKTMPTTGHWGEFAAFTFEIGLFSVVSAWLVIFLLRLIGSPARLFSMAQAKIGAQAIEIAALTDTLTPKYSLSIRSTLRSGSPPQRCWFLRVHPTGPQTIAYQVQIDLTNSALRNPPHHLVSGLWEGPSMATFGFGTDGGFLDTLLCCVFLYPQGLLPTIIYEGGQTSGPAVPLDPDDTDEAVYRIRYLLTNGLTSRSFEIEFNGRSVTQVSGEPIPIEKS